LAASPTSFDTTRIRFGDMVAGIAGVVLLISLFLNWYSVSARVDIAGISREESRGFSAWTALGFIDILLFLIAIVAIAMAVLRALNMMPRLPVSPGLIVLALGALALALVIFRLLSLPDAGEVSEISQPGLEIDYGRSFGIFIALIAAAAVAVGGWLTWNEEGKPSPGSATAGAGGAIGGGGPAGGYSQPPTGGGAPAATQAAPAAGVDEPPAGGGGQAADWYPDPRGEKRLRYWDGTQWTDHTAD
jgi:hypothetical protein